MDQFPVTNADFRRFVDTTGCVTLAARPANPDDDPGARPELLEPSAVVFRKTAGPVDLRDSHEFPWQNLVTDGYEGTAPVDSFPPNGHGLHEMAGNVWEWTTDWYREHSKITHARCALENPRGGRGEPSHDPRAPGNPVPRKVMKGGSYLCAPNYCRRYRPAARMTQPIDTAIGHLGFRCVIRSAD